MPDQPRVTFARMPNPAKALATCVIITLCLGMTGALGQIVVHDIIPTFFADALPMQAAGRPYDGETASRSHQTPSSDAGRGDLFTDLDAAPSESQETPFYKDEQFVWTLKWTHIHLFGINMIFIILGGLTLFLDIGSRTRSWLIVLPFVGVLVDILAMWLKAFVSPAFFWLHLPGGGVFGIIFAYVSLRALWEMWGPPKKI